MAGLGEVVKDDASYTDNSASSLTIDYYRNKVREFQLTLDALDSAIRAAYDAVGVVDEETALRLSDYIQDYESKKSMVKATAEAINAGALVINSTGGRFPSMSIPGGLGNPLLAVPVVTVAAIAAVGGLVYWGHGIILGINSALQKYVLSQSAIAAANEIANPELRDRAMANIADVQGALQKSEQAANQSDQSPLTAIANIVKWGAVAVAAWMAYQAFARGEK